MKKKKGFTLIELLVVVLIIGILAATAMPQYKISVLKSRSAELFINVRTMRQNMEIYRMVNDAWPASMLDILDIPYTRTDDDGGANYKENGRLYAANGNIYYIDVDGYIGGKLKSGGGVEILSWNTVRTSGLWAGKFNCRCTKTNSAANSACVSLGGKLNGTQADTWNVYALD